MPIEKHYSLAHAERVLALVRKRARGTKLRFGLSVWSNGREQGFFMDRQNGTIEEWPALVWARVRSGDRIFVIYGRSKDFDVSTHMPNEDLWKKGHKVFDKDADAAKFIVEHLSYFPVRELAPVE